MQHQGGFDCEFIDKPPKSTQSECPVCLLILREPYQVSCCGYAFCRVCIERIQRDSQLCPCCKAERFDKFEDKRLKRSLYEFCSNKKEQGCQWVGELGQLNSHLNLNPSQQNQLQGCQLSQIKCLHCSKLYLRLTIKAHQNNQCPKRPFSCEYCKKFDSCYEEVATNHWPVCGSYPMPCTNKCGQVLKRKNIFSHFTKDCPLRLIACDFLSLGCKVMLPRRDMPVHLKNKVAHHLSLQTASHLKILDKVAGLERAITALQMENKQLKQQVATLKIDTDGKTCSPICPAEIVMDRYQQQTEDWSSSPFYTHNKGYKICLRVRANGWGRWKGTHVSVSLYLMKGEFDDKLKWPFRGSFEIKLLNPKNDQDHHSAIISFGDGIPIAIDAGARVTVRDVSAIGRSKAGFISHSYLQPKYTKNGSLKFLLTHYRST